MKKDKTVPNAADEALAFNYYVDVPNGLKALGNPDEAYVNLKTFKTREEAIDWAVKNLGADKKGRIKLVS